MLTRDLLRVRNNGASVHPQFADVQDETLLNIARSFLSIHENGIGSSEAELDELCDMEARKHRDFKLAKGILRVVRNRAVFSAQGLDEFPDMRKILFARSSEMIRGGSLPESAASVRDSVLNSLEKDNPECVKFFQPNRIYADLPEYAVMTDFPKTSAKEILERYNMALVQTLILFSTELKCFVPMSEEPAKLRRLFKYLKFFRLLASAEIMNHEFHLTVSGPASILESSMKYGIQLASFFPAVCQLSAWKILCEIRLNDKYRMLKLDSSCCLKSHFMNFSAYVPEAIAMFAKLFREKQKTEWELNDEPEFLNPKGQILIFPDFSFRHHDTGKVFSMELFHRWHSAQFTERLNFCEKNPDLPLILGVDRSLLKKDGVMKARLESSPYFTRKGFLFHDFPGVSAASEVLNKLVQENSPDLF